MAKSRYDDTEIISGSYYASYRLPVLSMGYQDLNLLDGIKTTDYVWQAGDRIDKVAARFLGEDDYWWVICLANNIIYPFASGGLIPGRTLKIPTDTKEIFDRLFR
jgi:hypothetical protein